jgi:predicted signal transduction protein with EAL and GGDEF domain
MAGHEWPVTCSMGAVVFVAAPRDVDELTGRADSLMYQVKEAGNNATRVECFPPEPRAGREELRVASACRLGCPRSVGGSTGTPVEYRGVCRCCA